MTMIVLLIKSSVLLTLFATCSADCDGMPIRSPVEISNSYLDIAISMIEKARDNILMRNKSPPNRIVKAMDCSDVLQMGQNKSGVYEVWPLNRLTEGKSLHVFCDMDTAGGGWTVIQRRGDFQRPNDYFFKDWKSYKDGFGDIKKDFWLGNDKIFALTNQKLYSVRFDLKDMDQNKRYAVYKRFWIDDESNKYTLHIFGYSGDAGDSIEAKHNNQKFSTRDRDNDNYKGVNCAETYKGGWWYNFCHESNLNGLYYKGKDKNYGSGVNWDSWKGRHESLKWTEIKIRPKNFKPSHVTEVTPI